MGGGFSTVWVSMLSGHTLPGTRIGEVSDRGTAPTVELSKPFMHTCFVTIVSANYLAYAKVLGESVLRHAPGAEYRVLVVDRPTAQIEEAVRESGLNATYAQALAIDGFEQLAYKFDLVELNTALKPSFLKSVLRAGYDAAIYLDPDIELYADPAPILAALHDAEMVLTPHALAPVMDGFRPSDIDFLRNGTYNLGFVAVRAGPVSTAFLDWWERRCLRFGFIDTAFGTFVDQKWADLAVAYFDSVAILRHPGCNVAYWNLHEREVSLGSEGYRVGAEPLIFFHFSGVKAEQPATLSRHQTRHVVRPGTALAKLVADYCARLLANGHDQYRGLTYSYARLDDGTPITGPMRRALCAVDPIEGDPFSAGSTFQRRLRRPLTTRRRADAKPRVSNTLDLDQDDRRLRFVNAVIRAAARVIGIDRTLALLRYAAFLTQRSHFAAVMLDQPLDVSHRDP